VVLDGSGVDPELLAYLAHRWRESVFFSGFGYEIENGLLAFGKLGSH